MSILEFVWIAILAILFTVLVSNTMADCKRPAPDDCGPSAIGLIIVGVLFFVAVQNAAAGPQLTYYERYPTRFSMWNRHTRSSSKYGFQVTNYRKPNPELPPAEYMMGVEMAKSNTCHEFDFAKLEDIDRFKRCAHFFPEFKAEYQKHYEWRVGVCI